MPDLERIADDLDHVRLVATVSSSRRESLRLAAAALRALAGGDVAAFVALDIDRRSSRAAPRRLAPANPSPLTSTTVR